MWVRKYFRDLNTHDFIWISCEQAQVEKRNTYSKTIGTSSLARHLSVNPQVKEKPTDQQQTLARASQPPIMEPVVAFEIIIFMNSLPLSIVDTKFFRNVTRLLDATFQDVSSATISREIAEEFRTLEHDIRAIIDSIKSAGSLTSNG